jgi:uncharacterized membrane protein YkoI
MSAVADLGNQKFKGVVEEVGLQRNGDQFNSFNLTISMVVKTEKSLTYTQGEHLMSQFRKDFLGKNVEIAAIVHTCPICGKSFNTEHGMKQHRRRIHDKKKKAPKKTTAKKIVEKKTPTKKRTRKTSKK